MKSLQYLSIGQNTQLRLNQMVNLPINHPIFKNYKNQFIFMPHSCPSFSTQLLFYFISTTLRNVSKQIIIVLKINNNMSIAFFTIFLPYKNRFEISVLVMTVPTRNEWWCRSSQHPGRLGDQNLGEICRRDDKKFLAMNMKDLRRYSSKNIGMPMGYIYIFIFCIV